MVLIKENIKHYEDTKLQTEKIQATAVTLETRVRKIMVAAVYFLPRHNLKKEDYKQLLEEIGDCFILRGDYNTKNRMWGSNLSNTKGTELLRAVKEYECDCHSTGK